MPTPAVNKSFYCIVLAETFQDFFHLGRVAVCWVALIRTPHFSDSAMVVCIIPLRPDEFIIPELRGYRMLDSGPLLASTDRRTAFWVHEYSGSILTTLLVGRIPSQTHCVFSCRKIRLSVAAGTRRRRTWPRSLRFFHCRPVGGTSNVNVDGERLFHLSEDEQDDQVLR